MNKLLQSKLDQYENYVEEKEFMKLEKEINKIYKASEKDIEKELNAFFKDFKKSDAIWRKKLKNNEITKEEYRKWLEVKIFQGKLWKLKEEELAKEIFDFNNAAYNMINSDLPYIYSLGYNVAAYELENGAGVDFNLLIKDSDAVSRIIRENPRLLPYKKLDKSKDVAWNFSIFNSEVAKGLALGESIQEIAKRLSLVVTNRNKKEMIKHARTSMTSATNQGKINRYKEAEEKGIELKKQWVSTLDSRTRLSHAHLDGQIRNIDEPFEIGGLEIDFPGDAKAHPSLVYNCRCRMKTVIEKYPDTFNIRRDNESNELIEDMDYKTWYEMKTGEKLKNYRPPKKKKGG